MDNPILFISIFSGAWGLLGLIFLIIGLTVRKKTKNKILHCTSKTIGKVTDVVRTQMQDMNGGYSSSWHPVIEYTVGELKYIKESPNGTSQSKYAVGQEVEIFYNPEDAHEYYISGDNLPKTLSTIFTLVGIIGICFSIVSIILYLTIA